MTTQRAFTDDESGASPDIRRAAVILSMSLVAAWPLAGRAQVYVGVEPSSGTIVLSNFNSPAAGRLLLPRTDGAAAGPVEPRPAASESRQRANPRASPELVGLIDAVARKSELSPRLLHAVVAAESGYDVRAVSNRGALGLMQLLPATAKRFGALDPFSASDNLAAGAGYLKWLMAAFDDDLELVLAAYNAGEQAVIGAGRRIPPYPETQAYVRRIMADLNRAEPPVR